MKYLFAAASALALCATPALAQGDGQGNGNGGGNDRGDGAAAQSGNRGGGGGSAMRDERGGSQRPEARAERQNSASAMRGSEDRGGPPEVRGNRNGNANPGNSAEARSNANAGGNGNANRGGPALRPANDPRGNDRGDNRTGSLIDFIDYRGPAHGIAQGCPPGLARKYNGCRPPGLARQQDREQYRRYAPDWWGYGGLFGDRGGSYYYDDGFLLRLGGDGLISGFIPLLGGALSVGNPWPEDYRYARMPSYYESYYGLGGPDRYRYADNVVYRVDPETAAITAIAAMLTGDEFVVGQPVPRGYDVYNVPTGYRDRYYDRPDAMYRYNNGYVYQVDPETMLVASAIELVI